jgi:hypothetical protein
MIVLRIHNNNGIEDFLAGTRADPKYESLIISVFFQLFHDQFISIPTAYTTTTINVLLCFENRVLCLFPRAMNHKWHEFSLYVLMTRLQGRGRSLKLGKCIEGFM